MIEIDGSSGEGGGQILRSSLALSLLTGKPVRLVNIRAGRPKPGLQPQHLMSVTAAATVGGARVEGAELRSRTLTFIPGETTPGEYRFDIGTAGATGLVLHTIYLPLALSRGKGVSRVAITGGTHVIASPSFHFNAATWVGFLAKLGLPIALTMERPGFYPKGGGLILAEIPTLTRLAPLTAVEPQTVTRVVGIAGAAGLPDHVAERLASRSAAKLTAAGLEAAIEIQRWPGASGCALSLTLADAYVSTTFVGVGVRGKPAESVADEAVAELLAFVRSGAPVDHHSADQLVLPLAFAAGLSQFRVSKVTQHLLTNLAVVGEFVDRKLSCRGALGAPGMVEIGE
jgi:RNA 3'-terminal phosphate cyclase (ATP)